MHEVPITNITTRPSRTALEGIPTGQCKSGRAHLPVCHLHRDRDENWRSQLLKVTYMTWSSQILSYRVRGLETGVGMFKGRVNKTIGCRESTKRRGLNSCRHPPRRPIRPTFKIVRTTKNARPMATINLKSPIGPEAPRTAVRIKLYS